MGALRARRAGPGRTRAAVCCWPELWLSAQWHLFRAWRHRPICMTDLTNIKSSFLFLHLEDQEKKGKRNPKLMNKINIIFFAGKFE